MSATATQPAIEVQGLSKRYRLGASGSLWRSLRPWGRTARSTFWALRDVSFDVPRGQVIGVIGRNGAGKSTLLKILARITDPTDGRAVIRGRVASLLEVGTGFHPELTGRENVYVNGAILGMSRREIAAKFDQIAAFAEVEPFLDTPVKRYSSGMHVRLAFAVAAHLDPQVLLVDEVLAVGDAAFQNKCLGKLDEVARAGRTVLFVSHQLSAVRRLCHRAIVMESGRLAFDGDTDAAIERYMGLDPRQPRSIASHARCSDPRMRIDGISVNGSEEDRLHLDATCDKLRVSIRGKLQSPMPLMIEARVMDRHHHPLALFTPRTEQVEFTATQAGTFTLRETIKLPPLNRGEYHLSLYVTRADWTNRPLAQINPAASLVAEGSPTASGWTYQSERGNGWMLLGRAA
jgi:lipopolysaccharide transport system ATP-binding protein